MKCTRLRPAIEIWSSQTVSRKALAAGFVQSPAASALPLTNCGTESSVASTGPLNDRKQSRSGTILVMFLVSLVMLSMTTAALTKVMLTQRDIVHSEQLILQAEWLFQSAVARASSQLKLDGDYAGEEWVTTAEQLGQAHGGIAEIRVVPSEAETNQRRVEITVNYPPNQPHRARVSRSVLIAM